MSAKQCTTACTVDAVAIDAVAVNAVCSCCENDARGAKGNEQERGRTRARENENRSLLRVPVPHMG